MADPARLEAMLAAMGGAPAGMTQEMPMAQTYRRNGNPLLSTAEQVSEEAIPFEQDMRTQIEGLLGGQYAGPYVPEVMQQVVPLLESLQGVPPATRQRMLEVFLAGQGAIEPNLQPRTGPRSGEGMGQGISGGNDPVNALMTMLGVN